MNTIEHKQTLPLEGIRVVEFSHMVMGPTCGMILADLGAEVIKIEPADGDKTRNMSGLGMGFFRTYNRNKKSMVLDIKTEEGRQTLMDLLATSDVMLENFRPGLMDSLGLGYEALSQRFPSLIYVSHKGFLPGPYEKRLALDEVVQMMGGLAYMTGPEGRPLRAGASVNDIMGGMFGAIGVLAALIERGKTGQGKEIQSALFENCVFLCASHMQQFAMSGQAAPPLPSRVSPWTVYDVFSVGEGEQLFIGAVSDKQWKQLCEVLGRDDLLADPNLQTNDQRLKVRHALLANIEQSMKRYSAAQLSALLDKAGLPYAPITRPDELLQDEHLIASGGLVPIQADDGSEALTVLLPLMMGNQRPPVRMPLPRVGEHTEEILKSLPANR